MNEDLIKEIRSLGFVLRPREVDANVIPAHDSFFRALACSKSLISIICFPTYNLTYSF